MSVQPVLPKNPSRFGRVRRRWSWRSRSRSLDAFAVVYTVAVAVAVAVPIKPPSWRVLILKPNDQTFVEINTLMTERLTRRLKRVLWEEQRRPETIHGGTNEKYRPDLYYEKHSSGHSLCPFYTQRGKCAAARSRIRAHEPTTGARQRTNAYPAFRILDLQRSRKTVA